MVAPLPLYKLSKYMFYYIYQIAGSIIALIKDKQIMIHLFMCIREPRLDTVERSYRNTVTIDYFNEYAFAIIYVF